MARSGGGRSVDNDPVETKHNLSSVLLLVCEECRRPWLDPHERWRMYLDTEEPPHAVPYCPNCAAREFDGD
jgi:hypothetical protein